MFRKRKIKSWEKRPIWLYIITVLGLFFLVLPIIIVVPMSFNGAEILQFPPTSFSLRWYEKFFSSAKWLKAAWVSIRVAFGTVAISCIVGIVASLGLSNKIMRKTKGLKLILMVPMMLPSVIVAVSMYLVYGQWKIIGTFPGIILAHSCLAIPFVVTLVSAALIGLDPRQYDAARSLGASHFKAVIKVVLPLIKPAIFSSMLFAFITSFDESVLVLFLTKNDTITLPRMIFAELRYGISPAISAVSTILIMLTLFFFILSRVLARMRPEARAARVMAKIEKNELKKRNREGSYNTVLR